MSDLNNSINKSKNRSLRAIMYFAVFLIILGLGNIIFASSRVEVYSHVYSRLEALKLVNPLESDPNLVPNTTIKKLDEDKLDTRIKRARARLDFYRLVSLGGKGLLVISAMLILYCFYYSKDFDKKFVFILFSAAASFSFLI